jgi:quinol monooxygenase YgiN
VAAMTTPMALVVRFTVREGSEAAFDQLLARTVAKIRTEEPGTLVYACHTVPDAPQARVFYELYRDRAAFEEHEQQPHVREFLNQREALLTDTAVDFLALEDGKSPWNGSTA